MGYSENFLNNFRVDFKKLTIKKTSEVSIQYKCALIILF